MKKLKITASMIVLSLVSMNAAAYMSLISCRYEYNPDLGASVYVGVYRAMSGNIYVKYFPASIGWCPSSIN